MPIRLSGLTSGLDTESIVSALVSAYSSKKDKYTKAQTKLEWKQDAWKALNTKVYSLYNEVGQLRYSSSYALKKVTVSDSTKASVTASGTAMNGTQTLKVKQLAQGSYLTGAKLDSSVTADTTLGDLGVSGSATINVTTGGETKEIELTASMKVSEVASKLNEAGLNASYDSTNKRFFVSAKETGAENNFTLSAGNTAGLEALSALGIMSESDITSSTNGILTETKDANGKVTGVTSSFAGITFATDSEGKKTVSYDAATIYNKIKDVIDKTSKAYITVKAGEPVVPDEPTAPTPLADWDSATEEEQAAYTEAYNAYEAANTEYINKKAEHDDFVAKKQYLESNEDKEWIDLCGLSESQWLEVSLDPVDVDFVAKNAFSKIDTAVKYEAASQGYKLNTTTTGITDDSILEIANSKVNISSGMMGTKVDGSDAVIELNGAEFVSATNSITVNGLTIQATGITDDNGITVTTATDTSGLYDKVKDFLTSYNSLVNEMMSLYNADSAKDYEPLTDDEKNEMSDKEIEKWEQKIKDALLRRDGTLSGLISTMTTSMMTSVNIDGKDYSWSTFGIKTLGYLNAEKNENYAYHIDGDAEDSKTSGNEDKLTAALASDPDTVIKFLQGVTEKLYNNLDTKMKSSSVKSVYTVYNDKEMKTEYDNYTKLIKTWTTRVTDLEDYYYNKFTQMEKALSNLQNNSSSISSLLG